ncbi:MAG: hypothetical protein AABX30_00160 [Nanoarchaeota archaeon]
MNLEYKTTFSETGLIRDIGAKIQDKFPILDVEESRRLAQESLRKITSQGDSALYQALVNLGSEQAIESYRKSKR